MGATDSTKYDSSIALANTGKISGTYDSTQSAEPILWMEKLVDLTYGYE